MVQWEFSCSFLFSTGIQIEAASPFASHRPLFSLDPTLACREGQVVLMIIFGNEAQWNLVDDSQVITFSLLKKSPPGEAPNGKNEAACGTGTSR